MSTIEKRLELPRNIYLEVTNRCNLRCKACILYRGSWESQRDLTFDELVQITDQLPLLERIALHGIGEPLLNTALPAMIRHFKNRSAFVFFNTNGILLDQGRQNALIDAGLDELRISLDAASAQGYKTMRDSDRFDQIVANLRSFVTLLQRRRATRPLLSLRILCGWRLISVLLRFICNDWFISRMMPVMDWRHLKKPW